MPGSTYIAGRLFCAHAEKTGWDLVEEGRVDAGHDRDPGGDRALDHHRVDVPEDQRRRAHAHARHREERPAAGDSPLHAGGGEHPAGQLVMLDACIAR